MFRIALVAMGVMLFASDALPQDSLEKTLVTQEKKVLDAIKNKDKSALKELLSDQVYSVTVGRGRLTGEQTIRSISGNELTMTSYRIEDVKTVRVTDDVAILSYKMTWTGSENGKSVPSTTDFATATWALRDGQWKVVFYQDTAGPDGANKRESSSRK
jgi:hypothetical protein